MPFSRRRFVFNRAQERWLFQRTEGCLMENIHNFIKQIKEQEIDVVEHTKKLIEECKEINKEYNYFNTISEELALQQAKEIKKK